MSKIDHDLLSTDRTPSPEGDELRNLSPLTNLSLSQSPSPVAAGAVSTPPIPNRTFYKIRDKTYMSLFNSTDEYALVYPSLMSTSFRAVPGDLYVHTWGADSENQIWAYLGGEKWKRVENGSLHPNMPTHCLYRDSKNDRPRWVSRKTMSTYKCRNKARYCSLFSS